MSSTVRPREVVTMTFSVSAAAVSEALFEDSLPGLALDWLWPGGAGALPAESLELLAPQAAAAKDRRYQGAETECA